MESCPSGRKKRGSGVDTPCWCAKGAMPTPGGQGLWGTALLAQGWMLQAATFAAAAQRQPWKFPGTPGPESAPARGKEDAAFQSIKSPEWEEGARDTQSQ